MKEMSSLCMILNNLKNNYSRLMINDKSRVILLEVDNDLSKLGNQRLENNQNEYFSFEIS